MRISFLTVEDVIAIHRTQMARYGGGGTGIRDRGLLESAVAQPMATAFGEYLHGDLFEMASAYLFHIVQNHPFVDGNKRAGLLSALEFLSRHGTEITWGSEEFYTLVVGVAEGRIKKADITIQIRAIAARKV